MVSWPTAGATRWPGPEAWGALAVLLAMAAAPLSGAAAGWCRRASAAARRRAAAWLGLATPAQDLARLEALADASLARQADYVRTVARAEVLAAASAELVRDAATLRGLVRAEVDGLRRQLAAVQAIAPDYHAGGKIVLLFRVAGRDVVKVIDCRPGLSLEEYRDLSRGLESQFGTCSRRVDDDPGLVHGW